MGFFIFISAVGIITYLAIKAIDFFDNQQPTQTNTHISTTYHVNRRSRTNKRIERWKTKRLEFEEQKKTDFFKDWKREQYYCQNKQCAWCRKPIDLYSPNTHVDHIKPLMWWGTNEYTNLLLACKECNEEKGDSTVGWAGGKNISGENSRPTWIKSNRCCRNFKPHNLNTSVTNHQVLTASNNRTINNAAHHFKW